MLKVETKVYENDVAEALAQDMEGCCMVLRALSRKLSVQNTKLLADWFACGHIPKSERATIRRLGELLVNAADSAGGK